MTEFFTKDGENFVPVKDALHTQEDIDRMIESRLDRERKKYADYDELKSKATTLQSEFEDKTKSLITEKSELENKLKKATLETEKVKIIHEFKLSDQLSEFVEGDSVEDLRKKAEKLSKGITPGKIDIDKNDKPDEKPSEHKEIAGKLFGRKSDD